MFCTTSELQQLYIDIHQGGEFLRDGKPTTTNQYRPFDGGGMRPLIPLMRQELVKPTTILDWGCGEALQWHQRTLRQQTTSLPEVLGPLVQGYYRYDPYHPLYQKPPQGTWDWIVVADVLEHIPEPGLAEFFQQLKHHQHPKTKLWFTISTQPSRNTFHTGLNTHVTIKSPQWWIETIKEHTHNPCTTLFNPKQGEY